MLAMQVRRRQQTFSQCRALSCGSLWPVHSNEVGQPLAAKLRIASSKQVIEQNKIGRICLGVHWSFDASGGETVGKAVAANAVLAFQ